MAVGAANAVRMRTQARARVAVGAGARRGVCCAE